MQFNVKSADFRNALGKILTVLDKKSSRPVLTYALIVIKGDGLAVSATDLEVSSKVIIPVNSQDSGKFCVNARNLFDILRELPDDQVYFLIDPSENAVKITCNEIHYTLLVYKSDDYPHLIFEGSGKQLKLSSFQVADIINKTSHAICTDETRLHLNGIFLQEVGDKLRAVATDGYRLALIEIDLPKDNIEALVNGIILPKKGVYEIKKMAEGYPDEMIDISVDEAFVYFSVRNEYFISVRLITREYPKYQAVIPSKTSFTVITDKNLLFDAVRRIKIMSNEKSNGVKIKLSSNEMTVLANHPSLGDASETVSISYNGNNIEIGFNARFLIDMLSVFEEGEITLELNNELSPVVVKSPKSTNYLGIIMPLRVT